MSNPYGGEYPPYQPAPNPYDNSAYGSARTPFDGVSLAALICSATCCAAPVGVALGIAGLVRTGGGRRTGRWAAVTGLVLGTVLTLAMAGFLVFAIVLGSQSVQEDDARAGQCVDVNSLDIVEKADCDEPHDGEIIWAGRFSGELLESFDSRSTQDFCAALPGLRTTYRSAVEGDEYEASVSVDAFDEDEPDTGDWFFCYLTRGDGDRLNGPVGSDGSDGSGGSGGSTGA
ncbi:hypothetical protein [Pimelobacter sp. 30-1]|uniref:hypothetical protein n=1 Tax=Pimelobacter sp. 30-1 TaxID=2004991 RepID=UPI001C05C8E7|nr:hypothetical protein [Pimelobacter sp. 30-1]MBU2696334.1 hypothetical protein [Pimelobacter sp. 30-1]